MTEDPTPAEPGSPESLGLTRPLVPAGKDRDVEKIEDEGEPSEGNFA